MALSQSDLVFVLSGGITNDLPEKSIGGYPSPVPISDELDNLFATFEPREVSDGKVDYRCFYVFNDNPTDSFHNMRVWVQKIDEFTGTLVEIGLGAQNETQRLTFSPATGASGTFRLKLDNQTTGLISYSASGSTLASNIEAALIALDNFQHTTVDNTNLNEYTIYFSGSSGNRAMPLITVESNTITPTSTILPSRLQGGAPINTIAQLVNDELTAPTNIDFVLGRKPGVLVGTLRPGEGFPVWIKRTLESGAAQADGDGFTLHCKVTSSN